MAGPGFSAKQDRTAEKGLRRLPEGPPRLDKPAAVTYHWDIDVARVQRARPILSHGGTPMGWKVTDLSAEDRARLNTLLDRMRQRSDQFIGYPVTCEFDYSALYPFLSLPMNNVGDPYEPNLFHLNTHQIEREVLAIFREWNHGDEEEIWGYMTSGGTEGNMYGIFLARELYPDGVVYYSEDTHYSVAKSLRLLNVRSIMIKSQPNGEMDYDDLRETLRIHRDAPPIVFANIGTTMKGAVDDLARIRGLFEELAIPRHYIHGDAALSGMILPFVDDPQPHDFAAGIDSISISGHKMIGSPMPCGVVLARRENVRRIARAIEYVGSLDTTIAGSRNAVTPLFLWFALKTVGTEGFRRIVAECLETADYAIEAFARAGIEAWRNRNSITVVFPRPAPEVVQKWQMAVQHDIAHVITMPHVKRRHIDALIEDIRAVEAGRSIAVAPPPTPREPPSRPASRIEAASVSRQLTLIGHNRPGMLADVSAALAEAGVNIETIDAEAVEKTGILTLTVDRYDEALKAIHRLPDIQAYSEDVLLIHVQDRPGALAALSRRFADGGIGIRSLRIIRREGDGALVAVCADRLDQARQVVEEMLVA